MRILVVSDIHANWPALAAIREPFDACFCLGDIVDYGTDPGPCIDWVRAHATYAVRGNHDHAVAQRIAGRAGPGLRGWAAVTRPINQQRVNARQRRFLARLPALQTVRLAGLRFLLVHATPRDPLDEYLLADPAQWMAQLQGHDADIVCIGHTHLPFVLEVGGQRIVNPGSVGQPRDGDPRCAYAVIDDGRIELRRVAYDINATLEHMRGAGVPPETLALAESLLRSGGRPAETTATAS